MKSKYINVLPLVIFILAIICTAPMFYILSPLSVQSVDAFLKYYSPALYLFFTGNILAIILSAVLLKKFKLKALLVPLIFSSVVLLCYLGLYIFGWIIFGHGP
ncbi:hypothetical protein [Vagococcus acidifermentans]|uniref:Uncharacterized protein n=1 Tax=Vagococcus acidifermentans TaxID=564710 RepID=A0A430AWT0_9ENTE|nr:hypothetical protein [Vagococcus acidifermentans]RSU12514.1 hypothetical protein CBF27_05945 [Vagococcus acidifermentans]